jgi:hypothetical protein
MFRRIHAQFHPVIDHPNELEVAVLDFTEAAKDATVGVSLQTLPDHSQWFVYLFLSNHHLVDKRQ